MIDIRSISGEIILSVPVLVDSVSHEELMTDDYIRLTWDSDSGDVIPAGAYIEHNGEKYSLQEPYSPAMQNEAAFRYSPQFRSRIMRWQKVLVPVYTYADDGTTVESRELDWTFTGTPADLMYMIQQAIFNETGEEWNVYVKTDVPETVSVTAQSSSVWSVLSELAELCDTEWWADKSANYLYLSKCSHGTAIKLEVGKNIKTPSITQSTDGYYTRFYAFGSTRNVTQEDGAVQGSFVNKRLTLDPVKYPGGYKDIKGHFEDGVFVSDLLPEEVMQKPLYFDDIYPSSKLTISGVCKRMRYHTDENGNKIRIGGTDDAPIYDQYAIWYFMLPDFEFSEGLIIENLELSVAFKSGQLRGQEFALAYHSEDKKVADNMDVDSGFSVKSGEYEIIMDESTPGMIIPGVDYIIPQDGDEVTLFNIDMPSEYSASARLELEESLDEEIARRTEDNKSYEFESNPVAFHEDSTDVQLGRAVTFVNGGTTLQTRVLMVEKHLDYSFEQRIRIGNELIKGSRQQLADEVRNVGEDIAAMKRETEDLYRQSINYTKRRWRDAKQTITMLEAAMTNFSEGINPVTVETMAMLVGDEKLQFIFTESLDSDTPIDFAYTYDDATGIITLPEAFVKHMTLGIDSISPVHTSDEYKMWQIPTHTETLDKETGYYIYVKVSKENATGEYVLSADALSETDTHYHLLVGILNSSYDGARSFARMHGFTEVLPGQITTDTIKSADGNTWLDLLKGLLHLNDTVGLSGTLDESKGQQSIAAWFGGKQVDKELDEDTTDAAKSIIRHDGTGYFADGLFSWDKDKGLDLGNGQMKINYDGSIDFGGNIRIGSTGEETLDSLLTIVAGLADMWQLDSDGNVWTDRPVYSTKQISAGGPGEEGEAASGTVNAIQVGDTLYQPVDGVVTLPEFSQGGTGEGGATALSGLTDVSLSSLANQDVLIYDSASGKWKNVPQSSLVPSLTGYATQAWVQEQGYLTSAALDGYATQEYVTGLGYVTATSVANTYATKTALADEVSALNTAIDGKQDKITDLATIRSYAANGNTAYGWGNHAEAGYAKAADLSSHIGDTSNPHSVTKAQVGLGNVDNLAASGYLTALTSNTTNAVSITVGGTTKAITSATMKTSLGLDALIAWYNSLKNYLTYDGTNAAVKIAGAMYATGQIAAGGVGEEGDEGTGSVILDYDSIVDALGYTPADESDLASAVSRILALEGKTTAVSFTQTQTSGTKIGAITIDGTSTNIYAPTIPTSLPASDVYAWAKASTKPSYTTKEVTENTNLYFTNARAVAAVLGSSAIGSTSSYIYWTGSAWATKALGSLAFSSTAYAGGTAVTLNGTSKAATTASFYAPTTAGTSGYWLKSNGSGAPTWDSMANLKTALGLGSLAYKSSLAFSELTSKPTTIAGYGITDAYTASTIETKLSGYLPLTGGILTGALTIGNGADLTLKASSSTTGDAGDLVFKSYDETEIGRIWLDANSGSFMLRYGASDGSKALIHSGNIGSQSVAYATNAGNATTAASCTGNAATATKLATARTIWGQSFDGSGNVSGALSGATTISASSVICGTESIRVNAADNAGNFGYMRVETVSSNRGLVHIGANYGGSTTITNTSVRVDVIGLYRGVVGIGRTYTYDELYTNYNAGVSLHVDKSLKVGASALVTTSLEVPYMICGGQSAGCYFGAAASGIGAAGGGLIYTYGNMPLWFYVGGSSAMSIGSDRGITMENYAHIKGGLCVGASYTTDGTAGAAGVVIRNEGGIEISHTSTPYIDFHYANSTSDYSVRLINKASNTLNLYGDFCGGTAGTCNLGLSTLRWGYLYANAIDLTNPSSVAEMIPRSNLTYVLGNLNYGWKSLYLASNSNRATGNDVLCISDTRTTAGYQAIRFLRNGSDYAALQWFHDGFNSSAYTWNAVSCLNLDTTTGGCVTIGTWSAPQMIVSKADNTVTINGDLIVTGQVAAGGAGTEGAASGGYGPVTIDMQALSELVEVQHVAQTTMDALGLTQEVAGDMLDGIYTKVVYTNSDGYRECWSYDAYESAFSILIFIRQGDGYDINAGYSITYDRQAGTWYTIMGEI